MTWNTDISQAPRGCYVTKARAHKDGPINVKVFEPAKVILATKCGKVTVSKYLPDEDRWEMLAKGEQPVAWQAWPTHPQFVAAGSSPSRATIAGEVARNASPAPIHRVQSC